MNDGILRKYGIKLILQIADAFFPGCFNTQEKTGMDGIHMFPHGNNIDPIFRQYITDACYQSNFITALNYYYHDAVIKIAVSHPMG